MSSSLEDGAAAPDGQAVHQFENAIAGPSTPRFAPTYHLPKAAFNSIEYPGPIGASPASLQKALSTLGSSRIPIRKSEDTATGESSTTTNAANDDSLPDVDAVFNRAAKILELRLRPEDPWAHPIVGEASASQKLLVKIVKRRRKRKGEAGRHIDPGLVATPNGADGTGETGAGKIVKGDSGGVFTARVIGVTKQTVRFRGEFCVCTETLQEVLKRANARLDDSNRRLPIHGQPRASDGQAVSGSGGS